MRYHFKTAVIAASAMGLAGCVDVDRPPIDSGGGGATITPPPVQRAALPSSLRSADNDGISVRVTNGTRNPGAPVSVCLTTRGGMWKKEISVGSATLRSENGTRDCTQTGASFTRLALRKAKFAGVITGVGNASLDLTGWDGATIVISWDRD
ncbi:MAG: hypothetical protein AAGI92_12750 [Pseudomonadota bacterium]